MGKIKSGILGSVSGKVGNVVGGSWNGVNYLRSLPAAVRQTNSVSQSNQRERFGLIGTFLRPLSGLVKIGFRADAVGMSAYNAAFTWNYHNVLLEENGLFSIDFTKAQFSRGNLPGALNASVSAPQAGQLVMQWANNAGQGKAVASDYLFYAIVEPESLEAEYVINAGTRAAATLTVVPPAQFVGKTVHVYLGFFSVDSLVSSVPKNGIANTVYAGEVVLQ